MKVRHIIGADLSKKSIDLFCHLFRNHLKIDNSPVGFVMLVAWLQKQQINPSELMIVMEHTGLYSFMFEDFLRQHNIAFVKVNGLAIKRSIGLVRGKTDKIDAERIAAYGYQKKDALIAEIPADKTMKRLQILYSTRERIVKQRAGLMCALKEYRHIGLPEKDLIMRSQLHLIKCITQQIKKLQSEMDKLIEKNEELKTNYSLLLSIKGVGKVVALATVIKTNNFKRFTSSRKFACFSGTAPFPHTSGTSIRGRAKVSHLADKQMKTLLDQSAKSAIQYDKELKAFYLRRIESGKSKMSTINIVRNKIIHRMFAIIKRQSPYVENYITAA